MSAPIKQIVDNRCCLVTILMGQIQDVSLLLVEAHRQNYDGEWIMPDGSNIYVDAVVHNLRKYLDQSSTNTLLRGMFTCKSETLRVISLVSHIERHSITVAKHFAYTRND